MLNNQQCCIEAMKLESNYSNELMTMLNEYFKAIEKKLPLPLKVTHLSATVTDIGSPSLSLVDGTHRYCCNTYNK